MPNSYSYDRSVRTYSGGHGIFPHNLLMKSRLYNLINAYKANHTDRAKETEVEVPQMAAEHRPL